MRFNLRPPTQILNEARAISDYDQAIRLDPKYAPAYSGRGNVYYDEGDYDRAISDYDQAIRLDPNFASAYLGVKPKLASAYGNRGIADNGRGDYDRAVSDLDQAIRLDPKYARAYTARGQAYEAKNDPDHALADFDLALKLDPSLEDARRGRGRVQVLLAKRSNPGAQANASAGTAAVSLAMAPPGRRVALVIGMSAYVNVAPLRNPTNDARAVADAFRRLGFAEVIEREDLTRVRLEEVLKDFGDKAAEADWAVIYYAGHGIQINGANYVVPVDAKLDRADHIEDETVTLRRVLSKAQEARKLRMVIVDACRSNPFRMASADGGSRAIGRGLSPIEPAGGVLVAFAARGGTIADDGGGEHSPFTQALLANIETPDLDIRIMFSKVRDQVLARTNNAQEPFTYGSLPGEELYFKQSAKSYMSSTPPLPTGQTNVAMVPVRPVEKPPSPGDGTVPTRQKVVLYEENPTDPAGTRFGGNVTWRTERIARPSGQKPEVVIRGDIEIPERKISVRLSLQRNEDKKVPASHEVDVQFKLPPAFSNGGVANIPGIMVKDGENHRGTALTAAVVKVTDSFFLVGLAEGEMQRNVQLLKDRSWLDIPIVYADGKRALMAIEKGPSGERAFADAFAAWAQVDNAGRPIAQTLKGDDKAGQPRPDAAPTSVHTVRIPPDAGMAPAGATGQHDGTR